MENSARKRGRKPRSKSVVVKKENSEENKTCETLPTNNSTVLNKMTRRSEDMTKGQDKSEARDCLDKVESGRKKYSRSKSVAPKKENTTPENTTNIGDEMSRKSKNKVQKKSKIEARDQLGSLEAKSKLEQKLELENDILKEESVKYKQQAEQFYQELQTNKVNCDFFKSEFERLQVQSTLWESRYWNCKLLSDIPSSSHQNVVDNSLEKALAICEEEIDKLKTENGIMKTTASIYEAEIKSLEQKLSTREMDLQADIEEVKRKSDEYRTAVAFTTDILKKKNVEIKEKSEKITELKDEIEISKNESTNLRREIGLLADVLETKNASLVAEYSSLLEEKEEKISDLECELQKSRELEDQMRSQLQECISELLTERQTRVQLDSVTNSRDELAREKVKVQELAEFKSEIEKLKAEKIQSEAKIEEFFQQKSEFEAKIQEFVRAKAQDEDKIRELQSRNAMLEANVKRLEQNEAGCSAKIQELEEKLEKAEENANSMIQNASFVAEYSSILEAKEEKISALECELLRSRELKDQMEGQLEECISELVTERDTTKVERETTKVQLDSVTNRRNELAKEKVKVQELLKQTENRLKGIEKNASGFKSEIEKLKAEKIRNEAKIEEISQQKSEFEAKIQEFAGAKAQDDDQINELLSQNAKLKVNAKRLEQNEAEFSAKIQELEEKLEKAEKNANSMIQLRDEFEKAKKKASDLEAFFSRMHDKMGNWLNQRSPDTSTERKRLPDSSTCNDEDTPRPPKRPFPGFSARS